MCKRWKRIAKGEEATQNSSMVRCQKKLQQRDLLEKWWSKKYFPHRIVTMVYSNHFVHLTLTTCSLNTPMYMSHSRHLYHISKEHLFPMLGAYMYRLNLPHEKKIRRGIGALFDTGVFNVRPGYLACHWNALIYIHSYLYNCRV